MKLLVTIDVEPDCDTRWRRSNPLTFSSVTEGIPKLLRPLWDRYSVSPIYFVSPEVLSDEASCGVLRAEIARGAIVGAHLHSEYIGPDALADMAGKASVEFPNNAHSREVESEKIRALTEKMLGTLGVRPEWYRAARFGADLDTIRSLKELGYRYDSSVTPHIDWSPQGGPDHRAAPEQPYWIARDDLYQAAGEAESIGIEEFPVTISGERFGALGRILPRRWYLFRWLRPTHMTVFEQKRLIDAMASAYGPDATLVMMFHSMEVMIGKSPYVRNAFMQRRFLKNLEAVLAYVRAHAAR